MTAPHAATAITVGRIAGLRLDDPTVSAWLDQNVIDYSTYYALLPAINSASSAASFREGLLIVWQQLGHERYAVLGHAETGTAFYVIPRDAALPSETANGSHVVVDMESNYDF